MGLRRGLQKPTAFYFLINGDSVGETLPYAKLNYFSIVLRKQAYVLRCFFMISHPAYGAKSVNHIALYWEFGQ